MMLGVSRRAFINRMAVAISSLSFTAKLLADGSNETQQEIFPSEFASKMVSITDFMTEKELADANSKNPSLDHSDALRKALATSKMISIPAVKGYYRFKDVDLEEGVWLVGSAKLPYLPKNRQDILNCGSAIVMSEGGRSIFKFRGNVTLFGMLLYGDKVQNVDGVAFSDSKVGKISNLRFLYCGFYGFRVGIGNFIKYIKVDANNCVISSNKIGIKNIVDSKVIGGTINGNYTDGIYLGKGANDNIFTNIKVEWNKGRNFYVYKAVNNIISSSIFDRSGMQGLFALNSQVIIDSCVFRRNSAKVEDNDMSCHIYIEGEDSSILIKNIKTLIGKDDNKKGQLSPNNAITFGGENNAITAIIADSDLTGAVTSSICYLVKPAKITTSNNIVK
ncbi:right-handed parallel beta-helix repeat-containing protein [Klebsiella aerogenes]|uniref:right-handed parallel beta-helix repeat-containing protein n=2 Tax=Klebsiella aerogenes TaxID=548 RepID=UPI002DB835FC|nr:right-handed parallel beta-helix repeat-containing protein [Klebsiella aerogenes]MEB5741686.1 right-handed parallel beta-helix repeat-containing protein [Klebsiella aerogenes]HBS6038499.1 right-handed parallel beta-helix repeat-containing protein [Klebsiella aerogenes]